MFVIFLMIIVLSVLLRFPAADYPFDIFKLFFMLYCLLATCTKLMWGLFPGSCTNKRDPYYITEIIIDVNQNAKYKTE